MSDLEPKAKVCLCLAIEHTLSVIGDHNEISACSTCRSCFHNILMILMILGSVSDSPMPRSFYNINMIMSKDYLVS